MSSGYYWARQDEEDYWEWAIEKSRKKPADSPPRKRRRRSSSRRSPREKGKRSRDSRPMSVDRRGRKRRQDEVGILSRVLKIALLVNIGISGYTSSQIGNAFHDPDAAKTVSDMRKIIGWITVGASP